MSHRKLFLVDLRPYNQTPSSKMALGLQTDPDLVPPEAWIDSEQTTIDNFFEQRVSKVANKTCSATECRELVQNLIQGIEIVLVNNQAITATPCLFQKQSEHSIPSEGALHRG